jgi:hypothetical protein
MYTVKVDTPNVRFGNMLLEQFGGANGELAAAMQYTIQGWNCVDDLARRDLLLEGAERTGDGHAPRLELHGHAGRDFDWSFSDSAHAITR